MRWLKSAALPSLTLAMLPLPAILCSPQNSSFVHQKRYAMGTVFEIVIYDEDLPRADAAARAALDEVVRLDGMMSNYKPESDLSRMNRTAHFQRSEEHTSELQSQSNLVCRLLLEKKKNR